MKSERQSKTLIRLYLDPVESAAIRAAVGEVCYGFRLDNFASVIGAEEAHARSLLDRLDKLDLEQESQISVSPDDLRIIRNSHRETLRELGVEEYNTRTGVEFAVGQALGHKLDQLVGLVDGPS
jgi:hypothetical protein